MDMIPVSSSNLVAVGYEPSTAILRIQFNNGKLYEYYDVPQYIYDEFMSADSKEVMHIKIFITPSDRVRYNH